MLSIISGFKLGHSLPPLQSPASSAKPRLHWHRGVHSFALTFTKHRIYRARAAQFSHCCIHSGCNSPQRAPRTQTPPSARTPLAPIAILPHPYKERKRKKKKRKHSLWRLGDLSGLSRHRGPAAGRKLVRIFDTHTVDWKTALDQWKQKVLCVSFFDGVCVCAWVCEETQTVTLKSSFWTTYFWLTSLECQLVRRFSPGLLQMLF